MLLSMLPFFMAPLQERKNCFKSTFVPHCAAQMEWKVFLKMHLRLYVIAVIITP